MNSEIRNCQNCKQSFAVDANDVAFYERMKVPSPTFCWLCRAQRRFAFRNERVLYKRKSDLSGKDIFAMYSPESNVKVYDVSEWLGDGWDPLSYGREVDFSRPFLEQIKELLHEVPLKSRNVINSVNSDYVNNITAPKNCYLVFNASNPEDCCYGNAVNFSQDCFDTSHVTKCETCYESFWLTSSAKTYFSSQCDNCFNMWFSKNCVGCSNCIGCVGLRNKSYHIWNKPYSKDEYNAVLKSLNFGSYGNIKEFREKSAKFWNRFPVRFMDGLRNSNVSGNYINNSKNVQDSFMVRDGENLRYCQYLQEGSPGDRDCYDYSIWGDSNQLLYECHASGVNVNNSKFCLFVQENSSDIEYSMVCQNSSNLFGCVALRHKNFCILNKQYSEEEYGKLTAKIKKHMDEMPYVDSNRRIYKYGEFFPIEISPVAYNESMAQEYFPLTKEEAMAQGYRWKDMEERNYKVTIPWDKLSDHIDDVTDDITKEIISCAHEGKCNQLCTTAFRIIPQELQFYRKIGIPLPRLCPNCRTFERLSQRSGLRINSRQCQCSGNMSENSDYKNTIKHFHGDSPCPNDFKTNYGSERPEILYCEQCYQAEVV